MSAVAAAAVVVLLVALVAALFVADLRSQRRRRGRPPTGMDDAIDLHTVQPRDIPAAVEGYLEQALGSGLAEVRLIHGKGKGVQRLRVQEILAEHPDVEEFFDAPPSRGAWGATIARLKARD